LIDGKPVMQANYIPTYMKNTKGGSGVERRSGIDAIDGGIIFNWRENNPTAKKIFITKGLHKIEVEVENGITETFNEIDEKIFSTKDWSFITTNQSPAIAGVVYEGPPLFAYQDNRWGEFMNDNSVSPEIESSENAARYMQPDGRKRFTWKDVKFPESGQYDVTFLADSNAILFISGQEVLRSQGFAENPQTFKINITQGTYEINVDSDYPYTISPETNTEEYFREINPSGIALVITKKVSVLAGTGKPWTENPMGISAILIPPPCPRVIKGKGVVTRVDVDDPGNSFPPPPGPGYPVTLRLKSVNVLDPGINHNCGVDKIEITPSNGAVLDYNCDSFGRIREVIIKDPGLGFTTYPNIRMVTDTGINATFAPQFEVIRDPIVSPEKLIQVTDLVGLKQTGYVDGRAYYGAVFLKDGLLFAGFYETPGELVQVYATLKESIDAQVTTRPSAIQRQGTDITSNDPRLNIPNTPDQII